MSLSRSVITTGPVESGFRRVLGGPFLPDPTLINRHSVA
jgi:hypothetical protein